MNQPAGDIELESSSTAEIEAIAVPPEPPEDSVDAAQVIADQAAPAGPLEPALRELGGRLAGLALPRQVFILAIWPFLEQMLNFSVGFVDTLLAGRLSVEATEAMAAGAFLGWLVALVQISLGVGSAAVIARAIGGRHKRVANAALGQAILLALIFGFAAGGLVFTFAQPLCALMGATGESLEKAVLYVRIVCAVAPFSGLMFVGFAALRAAGDTRSPFIVLAIVNVINTALSVLLVYGPAPWGGHGVLGIAIGTAVAWIVGALITLVWLIGDYGGIRLRLIRLRPHWHTMKRILRVSVPNVIEHSVHWFHHFAILVIIGHIGKTLAGNVGALGAHIVAIRLEGISYQSGFAIGVAASTLAGQYLGLGDPDRAKRASILCWKIAAAIMGTLGLFFLLVPEAFVALVTDKPELLAITPNALRAAGVTQIFFATAIIFANTLRGAGDTRTAMLISLISIYLVRLPLCWLLGVTLGYGFVGVWIACSIELVVRGLLFAARFYHGGWAKVKI